MDCFVAVAPLRKRFAFVAGNDGVTQNISPTPQSRAMLRAKTRYSAISGSVTC
jgi:hypothetical protein